MRLLIAMLVLCMVGCTNPKAASRKVRKPTRVVAPVTNSVIKAEVSSTNLRGIQGYIGEGNTISVANAAKFDFGSTKLSLPAGTNATYNNVGDTVVVSFGTPQPVVTTNVWGINVHPLLEKVIIQPSGDIDAIVNELGHHITRKAVVKWADDTPKVAAEPEDKRPVMYAWSMANCPPCMAAHKALDDDKTLPFKMVWDPKDRKNPFESAPSFQWEISGQRWKLSGWHGKEHLLKEFDKSGKPKAETTVKTAGGPGYHTHTCPNRRCGTTWGHYDGDPTASHNCPSCGRYQFRQSGRM